MNTPSKPIDHSFGRVDRLFFSKDNVAYIEQIEFSDTTAFFSWSKMNWDAGIKDKNRGRVAYFRIRPKKVA